MLTDFKRGMGFVIRMTGIDEIHVYRRIFQMAGRAEPARVTGVEGRTCGCFVQWDLW